MIQFLSDYSGSKLAGQLGNNKWPLLPTFNFLLMAILSGLRYNPKVDSVCISMVANNTLLKYIYHSYSFFFPFFFFFSVFIALYIFLHALPFLPCSLLPFPVIIMLPIYSGDLIFFFFLFRSMPLLSRFSGVVNCCFIFFALCVKSTYEWVHITFVFLGLSYLTPLIFF